MASMKPAFIMIALSVYGCAEAIRVAPSSDALNSNGANPEMLARMNATIVEHVSDSAGSSEVTSSGLGLVGRRVKGMMDKLEEKGVDATLFPEILRDIDDETTKLVNTMPKVPDEEAAAFCKKEAEKPLNENEVRDLLKKTYRHKPFSCANGDSSKDGERVEEVLGLFDAKMEAGMRNPSAHFVANCMLQDLIEQYGEYGGKKQGSWFQEGFSAWDKTHLSKFAGLQDTVKLDVNKTTEFGSTNFEVIAASYFPTLMAKVQLTTALYYVPALPKKMKNVAKELLKKSFLVFVGTDMYAAVNGGSVGPEEATDATRALFYDNIKWAVDFERDNPGGDPENVELGKIVLKHAQHCIHFKYEPEPPQLSSVPGDAQATNDALLSRAFAVYTLWNYRFVQYWTSQDVMKGMCSFKGKVWSKWNKWAHAPHVISHTIGALITPLNLAGSNLASWVTFRVLGLQGAGNLKQSCDGLVTSRRPFTRLQNKAAKALSGTVRGVAGTRRNFLRLFN